ncbi:MAG: thioredoxin family protein, partial [Spirulina sp.]
GFGAEVTPEVFLVNQNGIVCYRGALDDCAETPTAVTTPYLRNAIAALLENQPIAPERTRAIGSPLQWRET